MIQSAFPPPPGVAMNLADGTPIEMFPVMADGTLLAFAWKPDVNAAIDLLCAAPASQRLH